MDMRYKTTKTSSEFALSVKILIPTALMFLLFIYFSYFIVLPRVENQLMDQKKQMLRSLGAAAWHLLDFYNQKIIRGEMTVAAAHSSALAMVASLRFGTDGKDYFWIQDLKSVVLMHPYLPQWIGKALVSHDDPATRQAFANAIDLVNQSGEGFIDYQWQWQDDPSRIAPKLSYVKLYKPWGWVLGTGFYVEDVRSEIARLTRQLFGLLIGVVVVALLFCFYVYQQASAIETQRRRAEEINRVLINISNAVNTTFDLVALYQFIHRSLGDIIDVTNFFIALYDRDTHAISFPYYRDEMDVSYPVIANIYRSGSLTAQVIRKATTVLATRDDILAWAASQEASPVGTLAASWLGVPLKSKNEVIGVMATQSYTHADHFDETDVEVFASVSDHVAVAIQRKAYEMQLKEARDVLELRVRERTEALVSINTRLENEIRKHEQTEQILRESEEKYRTLMENIPDVVYSTDDLGNIVTVNNPTEIFFGYRPEEILGRSFASFLHPEDLKTVSEQFLEAVANRTELTKGLQGRVVAKDGGIHWVEVNLRRQFDDNGRFLRTNGVLRDVTHTKLLQDKLIHSERMAATGELAASIAHEINSPLQGVTSLLNVIRREYGGNEDLAGYLDVIKGAFTSISKTVKNLLDLNRPGKEKNQPMHIQDIIVQTGVLVKGYLKDHSVQLVLDLPSDLPVIMGSPQQLGQVFMNLITNAVESINTDPAYKDRRIHIEAATADRQIVIRVTDTGTGIAETDIAHIFDAFFTSKKKMGMGVGLAICHRIIEDHNGTIEVHNQPERGAVFILRLPVTRSDALSA